MLQPMAFLGRQPKSFFIIVGFVLVLGLGIVDYITNPELALSIFYLIPISLVAWYTGLWTGILFSVISTIVWLVPDMITVLGRTYSAIAYWNAVARLGFFLIVTAILAALKTALDREKESARTDPLTGVSNRNCFYTLASMEVDRAQRYRHPLTIVYIDLDDFKTINDNLGHHVGDALLRIVAQTIQTTLRMIDIAARLGGDEFVILLPETEYKQAQAVVQRIQQNLLSAMQAEGWSVTFSIGAVTYVRPPANVDEMIKQADAFMYTVKSSGKNKIKHEVLSELDSRA